MNRNFMVCTLVAAGLLLGMNVEAAHGKRGSNKKASGGYTRSFSGGGGAAYAGGKIEVLSISKPRAGCLRILDLDDGPAPAKKPLRWTCPV